MYILYYKNCIALFYCSSSNTTSSVYLYLLLIAKIETNPIDLSLIVPLHYVMWVPVGTARMQEN
jgi:hypothetical protein